ncbi:hypothetical protein NMG60_11032769 [Bertholletia excelsa]
MEDDQRVLQVEKETVNPGVRAQAQQSTCREDEIVVVTAIRSEDCDEKTSVEGGNIGNNPEDKGPEAKGKEKESSSSSSEGEGEGLREKVCRICHLRSDSQNNSQLIHLGCGCKEELGASHRHCAETWFKHRGNRECEICGKTAKNVGEEEIEERRIIVVEWNERSQLRRLRRATPASPLEGEGEGCCECRHFCNFLLACVVLSFTVPWFFRLQFL